MALTDADERFHVMMIGENDGLHGFVTYWTFDGFTYIEHLAVDVQCRKRGLGRLLVRHVADLGQPLLLEVDEPVDEVSRRRIQFYTHLGLVLRDEMSYVQPPYAPGKEAVPMMLMTSRSLSGEPLLQAIEVLRKAVYRVED